MNEVFTIINKNIIIVYIILWNGNEIYIELFNVKDDKIANNLLKIT